MDLAARMDIDNGGSNLTNIKAMKMKFAKLLTLINYNVERNTKKALESAQLLFKEMPTQENADQVIMLENIDHLNDACLHVDKLTQYLDEIGEGERVVSILDNLPQAITAQPFAQKMRGKFSKPRVWGKDEICYFANFGSKFFEEWSGKSLDRGIGGSETAVIELSRRWVKMGYKVTVYCDPGADKGEIEGVTYLPWYYFNPRDSFNIFIQWRVPQLAGKIKARKFFVDLHDIFAEVDYDETKLRNIDKIMVKSKYHRSLAPNLLDDKFAVVGNGI
jgi:hypothetical protein